MNALSTKNGDFQKGIIIIKITQIQVNIGIDFDGQDKDYFLAFFFFVLLV